MFKFKYRKGWLWRTYLVSGFGLAKDSDRMSLHFGDGSVLEVSQWSKCDCRLGADYFSHLHKKMEKDAGQMVPVSREAHAAN